MPVPAGQTRTSGAIGKSGQPCPAGTQARTRMPVRASMTRAGTLTCPESTGTSPLSRTTGPTLHAGATPSAATAPRSGSATTDLPPGTAAVAHRPNTGSRHRDGEHRRETVTPARRQLTATGHRLRKPSPARRPAVPVTSTRRARGPQSGGRGPAADVTRARCSPSSRRPGQGRSRPPASGALLRPVQASPAEPGNGQAQRRLGPAPFRPCRRGPADLPQADPARFSLAGSSLAGSSQARGRAQPAPARLPLGPADAGRLAPAPCRLLRQAGRSAARGGPQSSRCPSSGPVGSWRSAPSAPG